MRFNIPYTAERLERLTNSFPSDMATFKHDGDEIQITTNNVESVVNDIMDIVNDEAREKYSEKPQTITLHPDIVALLKESIDDIIKRELIMMDGIEFHQPDNEYMQRITFQPQKLGYLYSLFFKAGRKYQQLPAEQR